MGLATARLASGDRTLSRLVLGPDAQPLYPDPMDDEFDDGSFDTGKWSWLDQGGATASEPQGALVLSLNENVDRIRGVTQAAPSAPWEFRAKILTPTAATRGGRFASHLFAAEDATGEVRAISYNQAGTESETRGLSFATPSTGLAAWERDPATGLGYGTRFFYARLNYDGTDIVGSLSYDGDNFIGIGSITPAYTPSLVGLGITNAINSMIHFSFGWFRRVI